MSFRDFNSTDATTWGSTGGNQSTLNQSNHSHSNESWLNSNNNINHNTNKNVNDSNNNANNNSNGRTPDPAARQHTRHARRLYFGGIPVDYAEEEMFRTYLNSIISVGLEEENDYSYIISVYINPKKFFAFVELKSIELTTACLDLDGIIYHGSVLKVHRANEYKPELVQKTQSMPMIKLNVSSNSFIQLARGDYANSHSTVTNNNLDNSNHGNNKSNINDNNLSLNTNSSNIVTKGTLSNITAGTIVIIGFPYEEGLRRCNRRLGTANGPKVARRIIKKMTNNSNPEFDADFAELSIIDLGDIVPGPSLEEAHRRMAQLIREIMDKGGLPIILGGSKDVMLSGVMGSAASLWSKGTIGMVAVDSSLNCNCSTNNQGNWVESSVNTENVMIQIATCREFRGRNDLDSSTHSALCNFDQPLTSFGDDYDFASTHGGDSFTSSTHGLGSSVHSTFNYSNHGSIGLDHSNHGSSAGSSTLNVHNLNNTNNSGTQSIGLLFGDNYTSGTSDVNSGVTTNSTNSNVTIRRENSGDTVLSGGVITNSLSVGYFGILTSRTTTTDSDDLDTVQHGDRYGNALSFSNSVYDTEFRSRLSFFGAQGVRCTSSEAKCVKEMGGHILWLSRDIRGRGCTSAAIGTGAGTTSGRDQSSIPSPSDSGSTTDNKSLNVNGSSHANLSTGQLLSQQIDKTSSACTSGRVYVGYSVESIMGCMFPGRDNLTADGFGADEFLDMAIQAGSNPNVCLFSITDFSPDIEEHRSSKMMGDFLHSLLTGLYQRPEFRIGSKSATSSSVFSHSNNNSSINNISATPIGLLGRPSPQNINLNVSNNPNNNMNTNGNNITPASNQSISPQYFANLPNPMSGHFSSHELNQSLNTIHGSNDNLKMSGIVTEANRYRTNSDSQMAINSSPLTTHSHNRMMMKSKDPSNIINNHNNHIYIDSNFNNFNTATHHKYDNNSGTLSNNHSNFNTATHHKYDNNSGTLSNNHSKGNVTSGHFQVRLYPNPTNPASDSPNHSYDYH